MNYNVLSVTGEPLKTLHTSFGPNHVLHMVVDGNMLDKNKQYSVTRIDETTHAVLDSITGVVELLIEEAK